MLNPEQQETAARHFCQLLDRDPDALFQYVDDDGNEQVTENWKMAVVPIQEHLAAHNAICAALGPKPKIIPPPPRPRIHVVPDNGNGSKLRKK